MSAEEVIKVSLLFPNGARYQGEAFNPASGILVRTGVGKQITANWIVYTGEWRQDKMHGKGTLQYPSGVMYKGEFKDNMLHGMGTYTFQDGSKYKGQFIKNRLEGDGSFTNTKGVVWTGEFHGKDALDLMMQHSI
ncbi:MORN repeat-containing protein 2 [Limanda limanda]|uniref:MORN repeat-containing protein 2 n=1 Tax=Limanda limanda TaxID=27771 RepID=UPI0029C63FBE|nr:MORN repeat-containing protein 2 [Limanda limanda]